MVWQSLCSLSKHSLVQHFSLQLCIPTLISLYGTLVLLIFPTFWNHFYKDFLDLYPKRKALCLKTTFFIKNILYVHQECIPKWSYRKVQPWLVWLSGLSASLWTKGSLVWFPVSEYAWVWVRSPVGDAQEATTHLCFSPFLSPSFPLCLKLNK